MNSTKRYENFPPAMVLLCSSVPITTYVIGILILAGFGVSSSACHSREQALYRKGPEGRC